ncbi:hypothetical protein T265_15515, partial [Opisthorchis viverrini]
ILSCAFCTPSINEADINVIKTSEGLSTTSDTAKKFVPVQESEAVFIDGLNADRLAALRAEAEEREFQAEVNQMMKLIINSLYKNKEIFLRELISNASDALDKIRLLSLTDREALQATEELSIRIKANKEARTLHIIDTGIGMSKGDLAINLGTIAKSGTADFLSKWTSTQSGADASDLIGQFGVGFYSSFLVGKKVMVISKKNGSSQYIWESDAKKFHIAEDPRGDTLKRGTEIIIFLNDDADDYLEPETLQTYIKKYSQFINFPIYLWSSHVEKVNVTPGEPEENPADDADASVEEEKKDTEKTTEKTVWDWVLMNEQKPIWKKKPADITEEEYRSFYQALSGDKDEPLGRIHFKGEGDASFTAILFIPKRSPGDVFNVQYSYKDRIKLYVHRVFISDVAEDLLPKYLGFVVGIVDSDDLPLNVSREMLQQNQLIKVIRRKLIRKVIELIGKLSEEDYEKFWKEFSVHMKLGMVEDQTNRARLSKLLRFRTSLSGEKMSNLTDYVSHMKKDQDKIFYLTASSLVEARSSPFVERLVKKGYEIVYMIDPLDEFMMQSFTEFESKPLQNVARDGLSLDTSETKKALRELQQKEFESLLKWMKEDALKDQIEKAELSERLSDSPCALVAGRYGWSGNMERIMRAQAHQRGDDSSADFYSKMPKTMELNPRHPLVKELNTRVKHDASDPVAKDTAELLFHIATLRSGYALRDPVEFARKVELVMRKNLAVDEHEEVEPEPEESESLREEKPVTDEDADEKAGSINTSGPDTDESPAKTPSDEDKENCPTCRRLLQLPSSHQLIQDHFGEDLYDDDKESEDDKEDSGLEVVGTRKLLAVKPTVQTKKSKATNTPAPSKKSNGKQTVAKKTKQAFAKKKTLDALKQKPVALSIKAIHSKIAEKKHQPSDDLSLHHFSSLRERTTPAPKKKHIRVVGTINDHDCDGIPDDIDEDIDNDGLLDRTQDSDWDGELNHVDLDDDNDGIPDTEDDDANGDGILDCRVDTSDHAFVVRFKTKKRSADSDMDGIPDEVDGDDDDDGIPDMLEDEDGDQIPDLFKLTLKDIESEKDLHELTKRMSRYGWHDHDCDGIPDDLDPDDDNDGFFDNKQDSDRDGILNEWDEDDDNDGIPDSEDPDSNGDGIPDCIIKDSDGDLIPDHIDTDDDNDGIPDLHDPDHPAYNYFKDSDNDGVPDVLDKDDDNDGIPDHNDQDADGDGTHDLFQDVDNDGVPDSIDDDMDNDGIPDHLQDHDCDGIPDIIDPDDDNDGYFDNKQDSDNDGILNEWDDDDDNDGIPDKDDPDSNGDGIIDCQPKDSDGDGIPDHLDDDDDNDGVPDHRDPDSLSFLLYKHKRYLEAIPAELARNQANLLNVDLGDPNDKDCDGIPDHLDNDQDNDGKIDRTQDSDMDGILNHVDEDDDNDGIPDHLDPDANGDGIPDCRRDDELHYKLVRSPSGLVKKVIRIRKPTQEEQHIAFMVGEAKRKLIKMRNKMNSPPTRGPLQTTPAPPVQSPGEREEEQKVEKLRPHNPKTVSNAKKQPSHPGLNTIDKINSKKSEKSYMKIESKHGRKLVTYTLENDDEEFPPYIHQDNVKDSDENLEDDMVDFVSESEEQPSGSFLFSGAMAADAQAIRMVAAQKAKLEAGLKKAKPDTTSKKSAKPGINPTKLTTGTCNAKNCHAELAKDTSGIRAAVRANKRVLRNKLTPTKLVEDNDDDEDKGAEVEDEDDSDKDDGGDDYDEDEDDDGIPDHLEGDSDGDGIPDYMEDEDGDGVPDYLEDEDGDGVPDYLDDDSNYIRGKLSGDADGDGIPDHLEIDSDGDGVPDYLEDSDGDGIPDYLEDSDGDGIPDYLDPDSKSHFSPRKVRKHAKKHHLDYDLDHDGIPDFLEGDSDGNGVPDYLEDTDGDGVPDYLEDSDGDGVPDYQDEDATTKFSAKRMRALKGRLKSGDADGDGIPDHLQGDSDGDGIPDYQEDSDGDGIPDYLEDSDGDGIPDYIDDDATTQFAPKVLEKVAELKKKDDKDGDGIPDYLEGDSDGDGIPDYLEDTDGDGIPDYLEDSDGDGIPDYLDEDSVLRKSKSIFKIEDKNKNGIPDHLERDSDYDGTPDYLEDTDRDGIPDYLEDSDGDGIPDYLDEDATTQFSPKKIRGRATGKKFADADRDGIPDHLEGDFDRNGIPDYLEDSDGDQIPDYLEDSDNDGIPDYLDEDATTIFAPRIMRKLRPQRNYADVDGDGIPDHLEEDNDGDGTPDYLEDSDSDGIPDYLEDTDGDGIPDYIDEDATTQFSPRGFRRLKLTTRFEDTDGDGIPDHLQGDSDGDGVLDFLEDSDGDGIPDYLEDSDGDGVPDYLDEDAVSQFSPKHFTDKNRDGIPDSLEGDSDGDGIPDYLEDTDGDGIPDYLEDSDGDGIPNYLDKDVVDVETEAVLEAYDADINRNGIPDYLEDWNGDGIPNYMDDQDGDGIADFLDKENNQLNQKKRKQKEPKSRLRYSDLNENGIPDQLEGDSDGDGVLDYMQDTDKDGIPDYLDDDDPNAKFRKPPGKSKQKRVKKSKRNLSVRLRDLDSDGGRIPDDEEDADGDGIPDYLESDADGDGIPDDRTKVVDRNRNGIPDHLELKDRDGDGIVDLDDDDDDNDGIPDAEDDDDDNDGIKDYEEDENHNQKLDILEGKDSDGDGIPDYLDDDDDNDGIPDHMDDDDDDDGLSDNMEDENQNAIPDYLELKDSDGDGILDLVDTDDDNDNIPDYLDEDDDGDGVPDDEEDENENNIPDILELRYKEKDLIRHQLREHLPRKFAKSAVVARNGASINDDDDDHEDGDETDGDDEDHGDTEDKDGYDDDDDSGIEDDQHPPSLLRTQVNRVLRWIENVVGVENSD